MKTKTINRTDNKISIIGLHCNIARIYEIHKVGGHSVSFCYYSDNEDKERSVNPKDIRMIADFYGIEPVKEGDILCEVVRPSFDYIRESMQRKWETMEDINTRIETALKFPLPEISTIDDVCYSLLSTAYDRLNMAVYEVELVQKLAQTIAQMCYSEKIKVEHIAEAIQYRALLDSDNVKIY